MKLLLCAAATLAAAFGAEPSLIVQAVPHIVSGSSIMPGLMPGIAGVGYGIAGPPCMNCFGVPPGSIVLPQPAYLVAPYLGTGLVFYFTVETGNVSGPGTFSLQITESSTGKLVLSATDDNVMFSANATNIFSFLTALPDQDGYKGLEKVVFTATVGKLSAQGVTHIWAVRQTQGN